MKASEFEEFRTFLLQNEANSGLLSLAQAEFPSIPFDTLIAISSQEKSRQLRSDIPRFTRSHLIRQYISRYIAGDEILNLSNDSGLPPCLLCRFLLENLFGLNKQQITQCLKDPVILNRFQINSNAEENGVVSTARVIEDVQKCVECDQVVSPCVEMVRRVTGLEYEHLLRRRLQKLEIPFQSEEALRAAGFSKTPDIKLEVPIGVCGRIVNWIDSKASFGDEYSHKTQGVQQFQMYVNRFGPGLVIYWFGFIDELNDHSDVLLLDHFPNDNELHCLTRLDVQPQP
ncbi:hypothetical protein SUGI_1117000 [Cryptomeria japonica]|uniref:uncharacterized protein LOC131076795 isoform X1 n=1 Tax=Cryptomeria japonica TaxID=3369 RepID=UPI0024148CD0|nr:uncharacterized protein LOC131076795 isoform X1 [Cryptomeria japonica]GLJ52497.1 hypothetical protein SUGI_1117000 [Cryptomeria japonica]